MAAVLEGVNLLLPAEAVFSEAASAGPAAMKTRAAAETATKFAAVHSHGAALGDHRPAVRI
ncbi:MAG TPA: hypothetical protein VFS63_08400 [Pseudolabrys sp.]|nr:hypothetical protein [Pseudolabrys sp.]